MHYEGSHDKYKSLSMYTTSASRFRFHLEAPFSTLLTYEICIPVVSSAVRYAAGLGGLIGFVNSGSTMSLAAGGLSGAFLSFVGYCSYNEYTQSPVTSKLWPALSLAVSAPLTVVMANRYTRRTHSSGRLRSRLSAGMTIFYVWILTKKSKPQYKKKA
ncbi:TMEM14 family [Phytophthora cactorum]|nr:TMEM14 family [Phytophthora cactorum]